MSAVDLFIGLNIGLFVPGLIKFDITRLKASNSRLLQGLFPKSTDETPQQRSTTTPTRWHAMPCGTRLELADTGFYIELSPGHKEQPYRCFTPEGALRASTSDLHALKRFSEQEATERAEFTAAKGWTL